MPKYEKQIYWNHSSARVLSCNFAAYFQSTFLKEQFRRAASKAIISSYSAIAPKLALEMPHLCNAVVAAILLKLGSTTDFFVTIF